MKIKKDTVSKATKKRTVVVELDPDEVILVGRKGSYFKLGYPHEDIVPFEVLEDARPVVWCPVSQAWVE
jgi:hypothetical protein